MNLSFITVKERDTFPMLIYPEPNMFIIPMD